MNIMEGIGTEEYARYPFLADAGKYVNSLGFSIEQFGNDPDLVPYVKLATERIMAAINGKIYTTELEKGNSSRGILDKEVFSFLISVVILKLAKKSYLTKRFVLAESRRAERFLVGNLKSGSNEGIIAAKILAELFSVNVKYTQQGYQIPVTDYIRHSVHFHEREWKLVNRTVVDGMVVLDVKKTIRLLRYDLVNYIQERISKAPIPPMMPNFEDVVKKLVNVTKGLEPKYELVTGEHPPCIQHAIQVLQQGENLPHSGRFMLATFLLNRGWSIEKIAPLFKSAPDYNENITMYQLNNLAGTEGTNRYNCPLCDKLRTQDLCFETVKCRGIVTPVQFGTRRKMT